MNDGKKRQEYFQTQFLFPGLPQFRGVGDVFPEPVK